MNTSTILNALLVKSVVTDSVWATSFIFILTQFFVKTTTLASKVTSTQCLFLRDLGKTVLSIISPSIVFQLTRFLLSSENLTAVYRL